MKTIDRIICGKFEMKHHHYYYCSFYDTRGCSKGWTGPLNPLKQRPSVLRLRSGPQTGHRKVRFRCACMAYVWSVLTANINNFVTQRPCTLEMLSGTFWPRRGAAFSLFFVFPARSPFAVFPPRLFSLYRVECSLIYSFRYLCSWRHSRLFDCFALAAGWQAGR